MLSFLWDNFFTVFVLVGVISWFIVLIGAQLVAYADKLALRFNLSGGLIGFVLVAAVTSIPEMVSTFISAAQGYPALAAGNIYGSNAVNIALLALIFLLANVKLTALSKESLAALLGSLIMLGLVSFIFIFGRTTRIYDLFPMILTLSIYLLLMLLNHSLITQETQLSDHKGNGAIQGFLLFSILIIGCSWLLVFTCVRLTELPFPFLGKPLGEHFVGTLILALATSVPELVTTTTMVKNSWKDMAFGNIFGSNVFNLTVFSIAPLFSENDFWSGVPDGLIFTALIVLLLSALTAIASLIVRKKAQHMVFVTIILVWVLSLTLVF